MKNPLLRLKAKSNIKRIYIHRNANKRLSTAPQKNHAHKKLENKLV